MPKSLGLNLIHLIPLLVELVVVVLVVMALIKYLRNGKRRATSAVPATESRPADAGDLGVGAELDRLAGLHARRALTDEEFAAAKARVLS